MADSKNRPPWAAVKVPNDAINQARRAPAELELAEAAPQGPVLLRDRLPLLRRSVGRPQHRHRTHPATERVAIVTDVGWVRHTVNALRFLIPGEVRVFTTHEAYQGGVPSLMPIVILLSHSTPRCGTR